MPRARILAASHSGHCVIGRDDHVYCYGDVTGPSIKLPSLGGADPLRSAKGLKAWLRAAQKRPKALERKLREVVSRSARRSPPPPAMRRFGPFRRPVAVGVGTAHVCVLEAAGAVKCWGINLAGQLGDDTRHRRTTPVRALGLPPARVLAVGDAHTCAATCDGKVYCWGHAAKGLGVDRTHMVGYFHVVRPSLVRGIDDVVDLEAGKDHVCAVRRDGTVWCWGGILWSSNPGSGMVPKQVPGPTGAKLLSAGRGFSCASSARDTWCWGTRSLYGRLGDAERDTTARVHRLAGLAPVARLASGQSFTCAVMRADHALRCWGKLSPGFSYGRQLSAPAAMTQWPGRVTEVAVGWGHACVLDRQRRLDCVGRLRPSMIEENFPDFTVP